MLASGEVSLQELPLIFIRIRSSQQLKDFGTKLGKPLLNLVTGFNLLNLIQVVLKITLLHFMKFNT